MNHLSNIPSGTFMYVVKLSQKEKSLSYIANVRCDREGTNWQEFFTTTQSG